MANASFCWLPPDSEEARISSEPVRMPNVSTAVRKCLLFRLRIQPGVGILLQRHQRQVLAQAERYVQALALAVLAKVGEALVGRIARIAKSHRAAAQLDAFGMVLTQPQQPLEQLGAPGADQPGETEDLAGPHFEADILRPSPGR